MLKNKLRNIVWPLWQRFRRSQPQINVTANILTISSAGAEQINLGVPLSTNAAGQRAWVLSPSELKTFNQSLKSNSGAESKDKPSISTLNGGQARLMMVNTVLAGTNRIQVGTIVDLLPKAFSGSVKLLIGITSTEYLGLTSNGVPMIRTNLAAACRVLIPNTGGLVVDGGNNQNNSESNYWLVITPTLTDARGSVIKP